MDGWNDMNAYLYNEADLKPPAMHFWNYDREKNVYTNFQVDLNTHTILRGLCMSECIVWIGVTNVQLKVRNISYTLQRVPL